LRGANAHIHGAEPDGNWESSWSQQTVSVEEWAELGADVRREARVLLGWLEADPHWADENYLIGALAILPHMAFHLGAIRQLMKIV
jgi:hypothetical protein